MVMNRTCIAALMLAVGFAGPVAAGPYADGIAAYMKGDYATALRLMLPLAEQGDAAAQYELGFMYFDGQGIGRDYTAAVSWFRKAADQGNASAQVSLGQMYRDGQGVPQDYVIAHMWFNLAAASGNKIAVKARDNVAARMTPAQVAEAQKLAREWKSK
jgi:uncharacterized protein